MSALKHRVLRGVGAQAYAQLLQLVVRLAEVPVFLLIWSATRYGEWLVVAAIPSYLTFADGGFATTSAREMTIRLASGDRRGALAVYQSSQALLLLIGVLGVLLGAGVLYGTPLVAHYAPQGAGDVRLALLVLMVYVVLGFQTGLSYGVYCAEKRYARGTVLGSTFLLVDLLASVAGGWLLDTVVGAALGLLASRATLLACYALTLRRVAPWCHSGLAHASRAEVARLALPSLGSMAIPLGIGGNISGMRILVGAVLGPAVVPLYSAMRTLARSAQTPMLFVIRILEPELAIAFGAGDLDTVRLLLRKACQIATWSGIVVTALMLAIAWPLFPIWVHWRFALDPASFLLLLAASAINGFWYTALQVAYATNRMHRIAVPFAVIYGFVCIALGWLLMRGMGLPGASLALVLVELAMTAIAVPQALRLSGDSAGGLLRAVLAPPTDLRAILRNKSRGAALS